MNILFQLPLKMDLTNQALGPFFGLIQKRLDRVKRSTTELVMNSCSGLSDFEDYAKLGLRFINDADVLKSILDGKKENTDGVIISCFFDPALWPARQMLDVPVTALGEASFHIASMMGRRFAVLAGDARYVAPMEEIIKTYDMRGLAIDHRPVRSLDTPEMMALGCLAQGDISPVINRVKEVGEACINDGADVLIIGCGILSVIVTEGAGISDINGVPIVDPDVASVKVVEMMVDIARAGIPIKSKGGLLA